MFLVFSAFYIILRKDVTRSYDVYDTDDFVVNTVNGVELCNAIDMLGLDKFRNIVRDDEGYRIKMCRGIMGVKLECSGWRWEGEGVTDWCLSFRGSAISFYADVDCILFNSVLALRLLDSTKFFMKFGFRYIEYIEDGGFYLLHYWVVSGADDICVAVDKNSDLLGVSGFRGIPVQAYVCDDRLLSYCAKKSLISGEGWWDKLICL